MLSEEPGKARSLKWSPPSAEKCAIVKHEPINLPSDNLKSGAAPH